MAITGGQDQTFTFDYISTVANRDGASASPVQERSCVGGGSGAHLGSGAAKIACTAPGLCARAFRRRAEGPTVIPIPRRMRAVGLAAPGGPQVWRLTERRVPHPGSGGVLVKVAA